MKKITELLEKGFCFSVEIVPPRNGSDFEKFMKEISALKGKIDFLSVTKGAGGSLRGGSLPIAYFAQKELGVPCIAHFVCRERTRQEIENDLADINYFGISNILALRGDPPAGSSEQWSGDYKYAYLLMKQINEMNNGKYLPRNNNEGEFRAGNKTDFCIIAAGHPEDPVEDEIMHMKLKIQNGAEAVITQMVFSFEEYKAYVESIGKAGIVVPVIAGIRPLVSLKQALDAESFFKVKIDENLKKGLEEKGREFGIAYFSDFIRKLRKYKAAGAHLFALNDTSLALELIEKSK